MTLGQEQSIRTVQWTLEWSIGTLEQAIITVYYDISM